MALTALTLITLVACGGATASTAPGQAGGGETATQTPNSGGGSGTGDYCLNTNEEVAAAFDVEVAEASSTENAGVGGGCIYNAADGSLIYAVAVITAGDPGAQLDAARANEGAETISGIGDDAVLISPGGPLAIRKGSALISLGAGALDIVQDAPAYKTALVELGRTAADRLP